MLKNRQTSVGVDLWTAFPEEEAGDFGAVIRKIRQSLTSGVPPLDEEFADWVGVLKNRVGRRADLEMALALMSIKNESAAVEKLKDLAEKERDFVILATQNIAGLPDPLDIPFMVRSRLREKLRPFFFGCMG